MKLKYGPYSPSRLETGNCGFSFYHQYVERDESLRRTSNVPQARGSIVHDVFEAMTNAFKENRQYKFNVGDLDKMLEQGLERNPEGKQAIEDLDLRLETLRSLGQYPAGYSALEEIREMIRGYAENPPEKLNADSGVEERLAVKLVDGQFEECSYDDPDALMRGRADIRTISDDTTVMTVYDHKTQMNIEPADTFQFGCYAWVLSKIYPFIQKFETIHHFPRYKHYTAPFIWTKDHLAEVEAGILDRIAFIENRTTWEPTPHYGCQYCPIAYKCPAISDVKYDDFGKIVEWDKQSMKIMGQVERAVAVAGKIEVFSQLINEGNKELREFVKDAGPIALPGKVFDYFDKEDVDWTLVNKSMKQEVMEVFRKHGVDPAKYMGFSATFSKKIWFESNEALVKELAALMPRKKSTEFRGKKM